MPKYYVYSGNLSYICEAENPTQAAIKAISNVGRTIKLAALVRVNEQGFSDERCRSDTYLSTKKVLPESSC